MEKGTMFCTKYGILSGEHFKDCEKVELSDKTIVVTWNFVEASFVVRI